MDQSAKNAKNHGGGRNNNRPRRQQKKQFAKDQELKLVQAKDQNSGPGESAAASPPPLQSSDTAATITTGAMSAQNVLDSAAASRGGGGGGGGNASKKASCLASGSSVTKLGGRGGSRGGSGQGVGRTKQHRRRKKENTHSAGASFSLDELRAELIGCILEADGGGRCRNGTTKSMDGLFFDKNENRLMEVENVLLPYHAPRYPYKAQQGKSQGNQLRTQRGRTEEENEVQRRKKKRKETKEKGEEEEEEEEEDWHAIPGSSFARSTIGLFPSSGSPDKLPALNACLAHVTALPQSERDALFLGSDPEIDAVLTAAAVDARNGRVASLFSCVSPTTSQPIRPFDAGDANKRTAREEIRKEVEKEVEKLARKKEKSRLDRAQLYEWTWRLECLHWLERSGQARQGIDGGAPKGAPLNGDVGIDPPPLPPPTQRWCPLRVAATRRGPDVLRRLLDAWRATNVEEATDDFTPAALPRDQMASIRSLSTRTLDFGSGWNNMSLKRLPNRKGHSSSSGGGGGGGGGSVGADAAEDSTSMTASDRLKEVKSSLPQPIVGSAAKVAPASSSSSVVAGGSALVEAAACGAIESVAVIAALCHPWGAVSRQCDDCTSPEIEPTNRGQGMTGSGSASEEGLLQMKGLASERGGNVDLTEAEEEEVRRAFTLVLIQSGPGNSPFQPSPSEDTTLMALQYLADAIARPRRRRGRRLRDEAVGLERAAAAGMDAHDIAGSAAGAMAGLPAVQRDRYFFEAMHGLFAAADAALTHHGGLVRVLRKDTRVLAGFAMHGLFLTGVPFKRFPSSNIRWKLEVPTAAAATAAAAATGGGKISARTRTLTVGVKQYPHCVCSGEEQFYYRDLWHVRRVRRSAIPATLAHMLASRMWRKLLFLALRPQLKRLENGEASGAFASSSYANQPGVVLTPSSSQHFGSALQLAERTLYQALQDFDENCSCAKVGVLNPHLNVPNDFCGINAFGSDEDEVSSVTGFWSDENSDCGSDDDDDSNDSEDSEDEEYLSDSTCSTRTDNTSSLGLGSIFDDDADVSFESGNGQSVKYGGGRGRGGGRNGAGGRYGAGGRGGGGRGGGGKGGGGRGGGGKGGGGRGSIRNRGKSPQEILDDIYFRLEHAAYQASFDAAYQDPSDRLQCNEGTIPGFQGKGRKAGRRKGKGGSFGKQEASLLPVGSEARSAADRLSDAWQCLVLLAEAIGVCGALEGTEAVRVQETRFALLAYFGIERCFEALRDECGTGKEKQGAKLLKGGVGVGGGGAAKAPSCDSRGVGAADALPYLHPTAGTGRTGGRDSILVPAMLALMTKMHLAAQKGRIMQQQRQNHRYFSATVLQQLSCHPAPLLMLKAAPQWSVFTRSVCLQRDLSLVEGLSSVRKKFGWSNFFTAPDSAAKNLEYNVKNKEWQKHAKFFNSNAHCFANALPCHFLSTGSTNDGHNLFGSKVRESTGDDSVHWSISNASVSFILDVLLDTIAMPEVILAWSFVLSELCTDLQPRPSIRMTVLPEMRHGNHKNGKALNDGEVKSDPPIGQPLSNRVLRSRVFALDKKSRVEQRRLVALEKRLARYVDPRRMATKAEMTKTSTTTQPISLLPSPLVGSSMAALSSALSSSSSSTSTAATAAATEPYAASPRSLATNRSDNASRPKSAATSVTMTFMSPESKKNLDKMKSEIGWESPVFLPTVNATLPQSATKQVIQLRSSGDGGGGSSDGEGFGRDGNTTGHAQPAGRKLIFESQKGLPSPPISRADAAAQFPVLANLTTWQRMAALLARLGRMLLYGATGQCERSDGEFLQEREKDLFDCFLELLFRLLPIYAPAVIACSGANDLISLKTDRTEAHAAPNGNDVATLREGQSTADAAPEPNGEKTHMSDFGRVMAALSPYMCKLWTQLRDALGVIEGNCFLMPERFGCLLRAMHVWTSVSECHRSPQASNAFLALVRDCCEPMRRHARQRRGLAAQNAAKFFYSVLRTITAGTGGHGRGFRSTTGQILIWQKPKKQQQQQPQQQQKQPQRHRQQKQRLPQKQQHSQKQDVGKGAAQATTRHHQAESIVHSAPSTSPWYRGTGHEWGGLEVSESLLELLRDPMVRNAINQLATTEPELLRGDLVFLFRSELVAAFEPANKVAFLQAELSDGDWLSQGPHQHRPRGDFTIIVDRISATRPQCVDTIAAQIIEAPARQLAAGNVNVQFLFEEGAGDGPLRELLNIAADLFKTRRMDLMHDDTERAINLFKEITHQKDSPVDPNEGAYAHFLELYADEHILFAPAAGDQSAACIVPRGATRATDFASSSSPMKPTHPKGSFQEYIMSTETKRRRLEACGRLLGLSIRNAIPLGVVMPAAIWAELMNDTPPEDPSPAQVPDGSGLLPQKKRTHGASEKRKRKPRGKKERNKDLTIESVQVKDSRGATSTGDPLPPTSLPTITASNASSDPLPVVKSPLSPPPPPPPPLNLSFYAHWSEYCLHDDEYRRSMAWLLELKNDKKRAQAAAWTAAEEKNVEGDPIAALNLTFCVTEEAPIGPPQGQVADGCSNSSGGGEEPVTSTNKGRGGGGGGGGGGSKHRKLQDVELFPGGAQVTVDCTNVEDYVLRACRRRLLRDLDRETLRLLRKGLQDVLPPALVRGVLSPQEAADVVSGPLVVDVAAWRESTTYDRHLGPTHPLVHMFWSVVAEDLSEDERRQLLLFWSGSPVAPVFGFHDSGFSRDDEQWTIRRLPVQEMGNSSRARRRIMANGRAMERVRNVWCPEASTCDRTLRLPEYDTRAALLKALRVALQHGAVGYDRV